MLTDKLKTLYISFFGNTISVKVNLLHYSYDIIAKFLYRIKHFGVTRMVGGNELSKYGMHKMDPFLEPEFIEQITVKSNFLFARPDKTVTNLSESGLIRLKNSLSEFPELESFINNEKVKNFLKEYYKSDFKIFSSDIYRTVPSQAEDKEEHFNSLLWHFDNCPENLVKIMIYLNDVTVENGAISLVAKETSIKLRNKGYWNRWNNDAFLDEIENSKVYLEGKAGSVLFFSTHYCIHKATLPETGYRDVAVFLIQPSLISAKPLTDSERDQLSKNFGYCINPFTNKPLRVGEE